MSMDALKDRLRRPPSQIAACKVCGNASPLFDVCDFAKNCEEARDPAMRYPLSGIPVYWHRCPACGFMFTTAFDDFSAAEMGAMIYNDDYARYDPDFVSERPKQLARLIQDLVGPALLHDLPCLDYGGGDGKLRDLLRLSGATGVECYDPHFQESAFTGGNFPLIFCFEVLEHSCHPREIVARLRGFLGQAGAIIFSTLTQPREINELRARWWYAAPRNGHVSLHTGASLRTLFDMVAMDVFPLSNGIHLAATRPPPEFLSTSDTSGDCRKIGFTKNRNRV